MYEPIWQAVKSELSGERARDYTARLWEHARWNSFDRMQHTAAEIASILREIGAAEVDIRQYPADGVTSYGGWVMPEAWDVADATLKIVEPQVLDPILAHYHECPQSLMMYSAPTPERGVVLPVVAVENADRPASYDGLDVAGKLVLVDGVGVEYGLNAFERGAAGVLSDAMKLSGSPYSRGDDFLEHAAQWHNYTVPPWRWGQKGFGFSLSPANGRRLRELLRQHPEVKLRAVVDTRLHSGAIPLVSGLLRGETSEEIAITAHLCEPGANDNSSGVALGLEILQAIKTLCGEGKLPPLKRGLRVLFSFEVRGYQAFLATYPFLRRFTAGINLDMVGADQSEARTVTTLIYNFPTLPAYTDAFALELLRRLQREEPLFRFRTSPGALVDNTLGEPGIGAPMAVLGAWPDARYHTSLDRIEAISPAALQRMGRVAGTYCAFLAGAEYPEALWLARLAALHGEEETIQAARQALNGGAPVAAARERLRHVGAKNHRRIQSVARLVPPRAILPTREGLAQAGDWLLPQSGLFKDEDLRGQADRPHLPPLNGILALSATEHRKHDLASGILPGDTAARATPAPHPGDEARARRLVPARTYRGSLCLEGLSETARREFKEATGLGVGWGVPTWLELAAFQANGKRSVWEIGEFLRHETGDIDLGLLCRTFDLLARYEMMRLRPVLKKDDFLRAFRELGLPSGALVMAHTSLSRFGYVASGSETETAIERLVRTRGVETPIEALREAIGPEGTLVMPAFSYSWVGHPPFRAAKSPSRVGIVSDAFRRRDGVLRSPHPTHSVAAEGPLAREITEGHTPDRPVFAPEGAFGKLYALDAWILMLAPRGANTMMHLGEERAGIPFPDFVAHVMEGRERREVMVRRAPWHAHFDAHYALLEERGLIRSATLGEETVSLMRARDAVAAAEENLRRDPLLVTAPGCECDFCRGVRAGVSV